VVLSSQAGLRGEAYNSAYCASKFALLGWAWAVAATDCRARVRVLCPGATDAGMFRAVAENQAVSDGVDVDEIVRRRVATIALGRLADADEVAAAAVWLATLHTTAPTTIAFNGGDTLY
jgi:NAD(P)-dependent dehydrogenase (short-subunit alcohol dehydrogenase family)